MEIIEARPGRPLPFGILSVATRTMNARAAAVGYSYHGLCGKGVAFTADNCQGVTATVAAGNAVTLAHDIPGEVTVDWGDGTTNTESTHTYGAAGTYTVTVSSPVGGAHIISVNTATTGTVGSGIAPKALTSSLGVTESQRFIALSHVECNAVGLTEEARSAAIEALNDGEADIIERALVQAFAFTDLTGGTPVTPSQGLSILMQYYAGVSAYAPTIHLNAGLLHHLRGVARHGNHLETTAGAYVSAGSGYDDSAWAAGDALRMYVTGDVAFAQGVMQSRAEHNRTNNVVTMLAETQYALDLGCAEPAYVEVTL